MGRAAGRVAVTREEEPAKVARRQPAELAAWAASLVTEERPVAAASQTEAVQVVPVPWAAPVAAARVAQELSAAALVAAVPVVQEQVASAELLAVPVVQEQAAQEQVASAELAVRAARALAVVHRMAVWGCSTASP